MQINNNLDQLFNEFIGFLPNILGAILILIAGIFVSKILKSIVAKTLRKLKLDEYAEAINQSDFLSNSKLRIVPSILISTLLYYFLLLIFLVSSTDVLGMESLSNLIQDILLWLPNLFTALVMMFLGFLLADWVKTGTVKACESFGVPSGKFIGAVFFYFILLNVFIGALEQAKINTSFISINLSIILAGISLAFALGYGLASKDMVSNFLVSFYSQEKISVGKKVSIDGITGTIIAIDKTSLRIDCGDKEVIIPLNKLARDKIEIYK